ncbi:MAG: response regulator transcription factor [Rickettsiales bacterium]|nr:response regulator transcription factor [Rickettsiales bacterium]
MAKDKKKKVNEIFFIKKEPLRILYAEDNPIEFISYKTIIERALSKTHDVEIENTATLEDTLQFIRQENYDIIILDLNLIDSKGYDTYAAIKNHCSTSAPIIILTGVDDMNVQNKCIKAGANGYFIKNISDNNLISSILAFTFDQEKMRANVKLLNKIKS